MDLVRTIFLKSLAVGVLSLVATLVISLIANRFWGGELSGVGLLMSIVCPLAVATPASAVHFYQHERLKLSRLETHEAREEMERLYRALQEQSSRDALTGVLNRDAFLAALDDASRNEAWGTILFLDVDHFKQVNDRYGHAVGDQALKNVGNILMAHVGGDMSVGRLGGEEFAVFLAGMGEERAIAKAEAIRLDIERLSLIARNGAKVPITISAGTSPCRPGFDPEEALAMADSKLYAAKRTGRNRVVS